MGKESSVWISGHGKGLWRAVRCTGAGNDYLGLGDR